MTMPASIEAVYSLSPMQLGMLFHSVQDPEQRYYFQQSCYELEGELQEDCFLRAWIRVLKRHPVLRTGFEWEDLDRILQVVVRDVDLPIDRRDWRGLSAEEQETHLADFLQEDRRKGFDLATPPLLRLALLRTRDDRRYFVFSFHHVLLDGWSVALLLKEVSARYSATVAGKELHLPEPRAYADYISWLESQDLGMAEDFWRETLSGFTTPTPFPGWCDETIGDGYGFQRLEFNATISAGLVELARSLHVTVNTIVQTAWAVVLSRYTGVQDVVFGATVNGRPVALPDADTMVGLFINTVPVRIRLPLGMSVATVIRSRQHDSIRANRFEHTPLAMIQRWVGLAGGQPLFETNFVFESYPADAFERAHREAANDARSRGGLRVLDIRRSSTPNIPLTLIAALGEVLVFESIYDRARSSDYSVRQILASTQAVIAGIVADPLANVSNLPLLTNEQSVETFYLNATYDAPKDGIEDIVRAFEETADRTPDAIALRCPRFQYTYGEMERDVNRLAHYLLQLGVGPEAPVLIYLDRNSQAVMAILGVLKAGGAYVPVERGTPPNRLQAILDTSGASVIVTEEALTEGLPSTWALTVNLDRDAAEIATQCGSRPEVTYQPEQAAYIIYTSGSTGSPKGVVVQRGHLAAYTASVIRRTGMRRGMRMATISSFSADLGNTTVFSSLCLGGQLFVVPALDVLDGPAVARYFRGLHIQVLKITPSHIAALLDTGGDDVLPQEMVILGGEPATPELTNRIATRTRAFNHYGPTECTVGAVAGPIAQVVECPAPLGVPLGHAQAYVLDAAGQLLPLGVPGELYIGGETVARGYVRDAATTAERFVPDPFIPIAGARMYRTGDRVRWNLQGQLEFLGRFDDQVKIRGHRVEPGDLQSILQQHPGVAQAVVLARSAAVGTHELQAFVRLNNAESAVSAEDLREYLRERTPDYLMPSVIQIVPAFPLTRNGKIDRAQLFAERSGALPSESATTPREGTELLLATLWQEVLGRGDISIADDFFALGGHSLTAVTLAARLSKVYGKPVPVRAIFDHPTLERLAVHLRTGFKAALPTSVVPINRRGSKPPFFCVHPAGGLVHCYLDLSRQLGPDQPFFGIQAYGLDPEQEIPRTIGEMASRYVRDLQAEQPSGPYFLGGWSSGGLIAYEMAQRLRQAGKEIGLLAIFDTEISTAVTEDAISDSELEGLTVQHLEKVMHEDRVTLPAQQTAPAYAQKYLDHCKERGVLPADVTLDQFERFMRVWAACETTIRRYAMLPLDVAIALFRGGSTEDAGSIGTWQTLALRGVQVYNLPESHSRFLMQPNAARVADLLAQLLEPAGRSERKPEMATQPQFDLNRRTQRDIRAAAG